MKNLIKKPSLLKCQNLVVTIIPKYMDFFFTLFLPLLNFLIVTNTKEQIDALFALLIRLIHFASLAPELSAIKRHDSF
jgi:hypothetical protein